MAPTIAISFVILVIFLVALMNTTKKEEINGASDFKKGYEDAKRLYNKGIIPSKINDDMCSKEYAKGWNNFID